MSKFVLTAQLQLQAPNNVKQVVQQIQSQLNGVSVNIQVQNAGQAQKQIQQVAQATNQATSAAERMGKAFALSIRRFAAFSIATRAVGLFTSTLSDAVQTSIDFERQLIKVSQVTGKSLTQLRGLTKQITDLSTGFGVASSDLLNVSTILAQAGLSAEDTAIALRTLAKSALAPNFDSITETAEGAIAVLAQFQEGVGSLEKQLGSINAVAGAFAVEAGDLIDVIRRTGGVFKASGGDLNELLALFTSVRATTRESAESIGTGLRTIFTRIQRPKTIEFLKQFGVELVGLDGKFVGPYEAVKRLSEALAGLGEGDTTFIRIAEELGGFRQIGKVLPLLQQFSTAQSALNVAMKAGDSLTQDAASSQAALAIRIMKVKEEFLALVRSITETSTFQVMANTALSLASALIKIGDSIKPLLPMLAALTAFKLVKGMGSFFGGMMSGAASGRNYNKGGKVLGFARGGLVPGVGNSDTVPAMLAPGEFVIRKSSVNKMGAGNLAAMNNNRYAYGGKARTFGIAALDGTQDSKSINLPISAIREKLGINTDKTGSKNLDMVIRGVLGSKGADLNVTAESDTVTLNDPGIKDAIYNNIKGQMYGLITSSATALSNGTGIPMRKRSINPNKVLAKVGTDSTIGSVFEGALGLLGGPFSAGKSTAAIDYPRGLGKMSSAFSSLANMPVDAKKTADSKKTSEMLNKKIPNFFAEFVRRSPQYGSFKSQLSQGRLDTLKGREFDITEYRRVTGNSKATTADLQNVANISRKSGNRQLFTLRNLGGLIQRFAEGGEVLERGTQKYLISDVVKGMRELQGNQALSQKDAIDLFNSKDARGDFIYSNFGGPGSIKLPKWMGTYRPQSAAYGAFQKAQADKQNRISSAMSRQGKTMRDYETRREFAAGGSAGTDTVPALLTPGEFVVNRKSAQRIGYGALHRMNKVGKYAKGGVVDPQRLFVGGVAEKHADRVSGFRQINNLDDAKNEMSGVLKGLGADIRKAILDEFKGIQSVKGGSKTSLGTSIGDTTRGQAIMLSSGKSGMALQIKGKNAAANTNTVAHETGHLADMALAGKKGYASKTKGTFQFDLVEKVKPQMEAAFKAAGMSAKQIETYLASNEELFAEFFAKASPEVRAIITSTTDSKVGMEKLANHLEKVGHTYAGLEASDIASPATKAAATAAAGKPPTPMGSPGSIPSGPTPSKMTKAQSMGMSTSSVIAAAQAQTYNPYQPVKKNNPPSGGGGPPNKPPSGGGGGMGNMLNDNKMMAAAMSVSLIQGFLPAVDESSSAMLKMTHNLLGLVTTVASVGFALEAFGLKLKAGDIMDFFTGKGGSLVNKVASYARAGTSAVGRGLTNVGGKLASQGGIVGKAGGMMEGLGAKALGNVGNIGKVVTQIGKLAGPAILASGAVYAFSSMVDSATDYQGKLNKAIEKGNVEQAGKMAVEKAGAEAVNNVAMGMAALGSAIPVVGPAMAAVAGAALKVASELPVIGPAIKSAAIRLGTLFGGKNEASIIAMAEASAQATKTTKALEQGQKDATKAMDDFKNGSISAIEALGRIQGMQESVNTLGQKTSEAIDKNNSNKGGGFREFGAYATLGYVDSNAERNKKIDAENVAQNKTYLDAQRQSFSQSSELRNASIRSTIARGGSTEDAASNLGRFNPNELRAQAVEAGKKAMRASKSGDEATAEAYTERQKLLVEQAREVENAMENIAKEVKRAKDSFDAMNLGLRSATATATALSASMDKFSAGLEVGGSTFVSDVEFLQSAMSSAAQAMDSGEIQSAVKGVSDNLREFGSSEQYIKKFEGNVAAFTQAQSNYTQAFANIKKSMKDADFKNLSADDLKKKFADELTKDMGDGEAKKSLKAVINSLELGDEDVNKILAGDLSVFGDKLSESQKKMLEDVQKIAAERAKAEQVLIDFTKKRIDAERNLVQAQQEALDLVMEGREIQGKYGGQAVTGRERKDNLLAKSNVESSRLGLTNMKSGDVGDLRRRNSEIMAGFSNIEARRSQQGGMKGRSGVEADEAQKDLQKAYKTQIDTIRGLIKLEEEQLKITQEKNKLEKDSMESLVKGDVEDFFKKQSAVGATAAIASGDTRLQNLYGGDALGAALQDIQRQQEAGVQSLYGQQLAGSGGLTEAAANAALSSRGVTDMRAAQVMAGTTAEEEASKARLRELGGMLGETGNMGTQMAEMQVETATINVNSADLKFKEVMAKGNKAAAEAQAVEDQRAMARGGMVYASRGIFVPRGTDTIPAMLTPGEFVVNRGAVQRGNNLQILKAMNSGLGSVSSSGGTALMASGGVVRYRHRGSHGPEQQSQGMSNFATALENFNRELSRNVESLKDSKITIKLDSTNVNINLNDGGLLKSLKAQVAQEIFNLVKTRLVVGDGGRLRENSGVV